MPVYVATGRIENGQLHIHRKERMAKALRRWKDCPISIVIEKQHAIRSKPLNDYHWAVVVPRIQDAFMKRGITAGIDPQTTHEVLKAQFMDFELVRTGRIRGFISDTGLAIGTSTTQLTTLQFIEFHDRIIDHAAQYLDTYIPPPDKNWREHAEEEAAKLSDDGHVISE